MSLSPLRVLLLLLFYYHHIHNNNFIVFKLQLICLQLNMSVIINYLNYLLTHYKYFQHFVELIHYTEN